MGGRCRVGSNGATALPLPSVELQSPGSLERFRILATPNPNGREIAKAYDIARRKEHLSPKQFLDIVSPSKRGRSEASAKRYLNKLRTGERSGTNLYKRAKADQGKSVNISFNDDKGFATSANVVIPYGSSRLDLFRPSKIAPRKTRLRMAAEGYVKRKYPKRSIGALHLMGVRSIKHSYTGSEKVR